jgi:RNA-directed DNA polymerase
MDVHVQRTVPITFEMVAKAYQKVKQGGKAVGVDGESWKAFEEKGVEKQLYVIWNRMSSGSYFPQAVREKEIPKSNGKKRKLGIPTLRDRIAQEVVKAYMEKRVDQQFHANSYGYRPMKSSHDALDEVRKNCLEKDWVVDMDLAKFFDEIDHELMLKAVSHVFEEPWIKIYVKRWLEMKIEKEDGSQYDRGNKGTPQGGVISPLLANLFLHYALDLWLTQQFPSIGFVRYADDIVLHCTSKNEAEQVLNAVKHRLKSLSLRLNEEKTRIVYCKDYRRREEHAAVQFGFLGYSFQPRLIQSTRNTGTTFLSFTPEISKDNQSHIRSTIREVVNWRNTTQELADIATILNPRLRGWIHYFGKYGKRRIRLIMLYLDSKLLKWMKRRHKCGQKTAGAILAKHVRTNPYLFYHWASRYTLFVNELTRAV